MDWILSYVPSNNDPFLIDRRLRTRGMSVLKDNTLLTLGHRIYVIIPKDDTAAVFVKNLRKVSPTVPFPVVVYCKPQLIAIAYQRGAMYGL